MEGNLFDDRDQRSYVQREWLRDVLEQARRRAKGVVILTHHDGFEPTSDFGNINYKPLWHQVTENLAGASTCWWYWAAIHAPTAFQPVAVTAMTRVNARCAGHGGLPYKPCGVPPFHTHDQEALIAWAETGLAEDVEEPRRALNGFALLSFDGPVMSEQFYDEKGGPRFGTVASSATEHTEDKQHVIVTPNQPRPPSPATSMFILALDGGGIRAHTRHVCSSAWNSVFRPLLLVQT